MQTQIAFEFWMILNGNVRLMNWHYRIGIEIWGTWLNKHWIRIAVQRSTEKDWKKWHFQVFNTGNIDSCWIISIFGVESKLNSMFALRIINWSKRKQFHNHLLSLNLQSYLKLKFGLQLTVSIYNCGSMCLWFTIN